MNKNYTITINMSGMWVIALLTFMVFFILKLANIIAWPWVWVFSPLWIYIVLFLIMDLYSTVPDSDNHCVSLGNH